MSFFVIHTHDMLYNQGDNMSDTSSIFLDAICLRSYDRSMETVQTVAALVDYYDKHREKNKQFQTEVVQLYASALKSISEDAVDLTNDTELDVLILKLSSSSYAMTNTHILDSLGKILKSKQIVTQNRVHKLRKKIAGFIQHAEAFRLTRSMFRDLSNYNMLVDDVAKDELLSKVVTSASEISNGFELHGCVDKVSKIEFINMSDKTSVGNALKARNEIHHGSAIMQFGLQGLNKMAYPNNGLIRGESLAFCAPSHHNKSGMLMNCARWMTTINAAPEETKGEPTIVFISLENEVYENLNDWWKDAYRNAFRSTPRGLSDEEIIGYVTAWYSEKGFTLLVYRMDGDKFNVAKYKALIEKLEMEGHEIFSMIMDYITLMDFSDMSGGNEAKQLQVGARSIIQYNKRKAIMTVTGLQMTPDTEDLLAYKTYVAKLLNKKMLADAKAVYSELDFVIWAIIEKDSEGVKYMTFAWGKHRYALNPLAGDEYVCYRFSKLGIPDDLGGEDSRVLDIHMSGENSAESNSTFDNI